MPPPVKYAPDPLFIIFTFIDTIKPDYTRLANNMSINRVSFLLTKHDILAIEHRSFLPFPLGETILLSTASSSRQRLPPTVIMETGARRDHTMGSDLRKAEREGWYGRLHGTTTVLVRTGCLYGHLYAIFGVAIPAAITSKRTPMVEAKQ
jgi:hypothetical protein